MKLTLSSLRATITFHKQNMNSEKDYEYMRQTSARLILHSISKFFEVDTIKFLVSSLQEGRRRALSDKDFGLMGNSRIPSSSVNSGRMLVASWFSGL